MPSKYDLTEAAKQSRVYGRSLADMLYSNIGAKGELSGDIISESKRYEKELEKMQRAQKNLQRRRGMNRLLATGAGTVAGLLTANPLIGAGVAAGLSYGGQKAGETGRFSLKGGFEKASRPRRIGKGDYKFFEDKIGRTNRELRDWKKQLHTSQITGSLMDALSAYRGSKFLGKQEGVQSFLGGIKGAKGLPEGSIPALTEMSPGGVDAFSSMWDKIRKNAMKPISFDIGDTIDYMGRGGRY